MTGIKDQAFGMELEFTGLTRQKAAQTVAQVINGNADYTYEGGAGVSDDTAAERINEHFADLIGDVVLEFDGEYYKIIDDYKEDIKEWIR